MREHHFIIRARPIDSSVQGLPTFARVKIEMTYLEWLEINAELCEENGLAYAVTDMAPDAWGAVAMRQEGVNPLVVDEHGLFHFEIDLNGTTLISDSVDIQSLKRTYQNGPEVQPDDAAFLWVRGVLFYSEDPSDLPQLVEEFRQSIVLTRG